MATVSTSEPNGQRWAIVTGAAGAIGAALSQELRTRAVRVAGLDIARCDAAHDLVQESIDIRDHAGVTRIVQDLVNALGPPDFVAHVAGVYPLSQISASSADQVDTILAVNLVSAIHLCRIVLPFMEARGRGRLLFVTSQAGVTGGTDAVYASSKAGLVALGKSLAREHGHAGVRVNMVSPGPVDTPMAAVMSLERREYYERAIPIGRYTRPDEVARLAAFALLDAPDALNGATIDIDGGLVRR
jgi:NAD(P)-dependent dehydrogenase (short-subunit alcohol dehydrogenase family)